MHRSLLALLSSSLLAGCAAGSSNIAAGAAGPVAAAAAKPQFGRFGFDEAGMDRSVAVGDDFYAFANGNWARTTPIPADKANYGAFNLLGDLSEARTKTILDEAAADPASKIGGAYAAFLDRPAIDAKGMTPIAPWLARVMAVERRDYPTLLGDATKAGIGGPFGAGVEQDARQPERYVLELTQAGLGLPDRDDYLSVDPKLAEIKAAYQLHLAHVLTLAGQNDVDRRAAALVAFETAIARVSWTRTESRDATKTYNRLTVANLAARAPGFDFATFVAALGARVDSLVVAQPSAVTAIAKLIGSAPIAVLRDQLMIRSLDAYADVLPKPLDDEQFAFYGHILSGTPEQQLRWKRAVAFTTGAIGDDVSKIYVGRYFPPETKAAADKLVHNIIAAMDARIDRLDWMAAATKIRAHAKLAAFTPKIGYPSRWKDYAALTIGRDDAFGNAWRANQWQQADNIAHLTMPLQRWEWDMTPMEVNAYANPGMVEIVFPAAILQPPFFDPAADPAINYGGIGAVIGHEMSHHFDDQGSKYDAKGQLTDWWTPDDVAHFQALTGKLVAEYDRYEPLPGVHVKGALTLGENIADLAGLTVAHDAYVMALGGSTPKSIDGFTGEQRFYLGWAQVWRRSYREANLRQRLLTDPHSPSQQRAWIVRNLDPWYAAFAPAPSARLYLAPDQRVRIW